MRIAIVGGGIGGLTLALALRQRGLAAIVYEQAAELTEIGAAVAVSANATRELARLGVLDATEAVSREPTELIWRDGRSGARIASHPVAEAGQYRATFGGSYLGIHRAALQRVLGGALGPDPLRLGHRLQSLEDALHGGGGTVRLSFTNGVEVEADLVVGADGVRSAVRRHVDGGAGRAPAALRHRAGGGRQPVRGRGTAHLMSNFRLIVLDTGFPMLASLDERLSQRLLAWFVIEVVEWLGSRAITGSYRGSHGTS